MARATRRKREQEADSYNPDDDFEPCDHCGGNVKTVESGGAYLGHLIDGTPFMVHPKCIRQWADQRQISQEDRTLIGKAFEIYL